MIRPFTCVCMLLAAGSGLYLYQTKHRAQLLDREIARTLKQIDVTHDRIGALKAEWALLNEPDRLKDLAQQHTTLKPLAPTQFVALNDLPGRLPAPLPPGPPTVPPDDAAPLPSAPPAGMPGAAAGLPVAAIRPAASVRTATNDRPSPDKPGSDKSAAQLAAVAAHLSPHPASPAPAPTSGTGAIALATATPLPAQPSPRPASSGPAQPAASPALAAAPRFLAPVVNVSAGPIQSAATAPGTIGESVIRAARLRTGTPQLVSAAAPIGPASPYQPPPYQTPLSQTPLLQTPAAAYASAAPAPISSGSALGSGAHAALPPPVPFGTTPAGR